MLVKLTTGVQISAIFKEHFFVRKLYVQFWIIFFIFDTMKVLNDMFMQIWRNWQHSAHLRKYDMENEELFDCEGNLTFWNKKVPLLTSFDIIFRNWSYVLYSWAESTSIFVKTAKGHSIRLFDHRYQWWENAQDFAPEY